MLDKPNSFGGSRMDRYVFEFDPDDEVGGDYDETVAALSAGDAGGAEAGAEDSAAEPSAEATPPEAEVEAPSSPPAEPSAPAWTPNENDFRTLQERQDALIAYLANQEASTDTASGAEAPELPDILDPEYAEKMATYLDYRDAARDRQWEQRLEAITPVVQSVREKEAAEQKDAMIDAITVEGFEKDKPEFREGAEFFAVGLIDSVKAELGLPLDRPSPQAAEIALQRGAEKFTAFAQAQREAGKAAYIAEMEALGNAPTDLSVTGGGREGAAEVDDYDEALRRFVGTA